MTTTLVLPDSIANELRRLAALPIETIAEMPIAIRQIAVRREVMQFFSLKPDSEVRFPSVELTSARVLTNKA